MRLAFLCNLFPPYVVGGNELLCADVVAALRVRGHDVTVLTGRGRELPAEGVLGVFDLDLDRKADIFLGARTPGGLEAFRSHVWNETSRTATRRALSRLDPDLVVAWNLYMASLAPLAAARRSAVPVIAHVADKWLDYGLRDAGALLDLRLPGHRRVRFAQALLRPLLRFLARPPALIAISEFMRRYYLAAGFGADQVETLHLGVPTGEFAATPRAQRGAASGLRLLYVGSLWEGKGPQTAVRALGILARTGDRVTRLDVLGSGAPDFEAWLRKLVADEGLAGRVELRGHVDRSAVRAAYQEHDVLVFPSQWDEPFAAVPVEAMSCGLAVVATTAGGTPEAITDGETGLLVPPADPEALARALRRLAEDESLRLRLGAQAAVDARARFDFDRYVDRLEARYVLSAWGRGR